MEHKALYSYGICWTAETPQERMRRGGTAHPPWKASILKWNSTFFFIRAIKSVLKEQKDT